MNIPKVVQATARRGQQSDGLNYGGYSSKTIIYPGTFDPITKGHVDLIERAAQLFPKIIVGIAKNANKTPIFSHKERIFLAKKVLAHLPVAEVVGFDCLLADFAKKCSTPIILRGLRAMSDFEFEFQLANMNRHMDYCLETVFLTPSEQFAFVSSSLIKEVASYQGDVSEFVHKAVALALKRKLGRKRS